MELVYYGDPVLKRSGNLVTDFSNCESLCESMLAGLTEANGIGLAAQHLGGTQAICVIDFRSMDSHDYTAKRDGEVLPAALLFPLYLVNPSIVHYSEEVAGEMEGSISFPGIQGKIVRPVAIEVNYKDPKGAAHRLECDGLLARCIQHEIDQSNGVLFIERMDVRERQKLSTKLKQLKRMKR